MSQFDIEILQAALVGLRHESARIDEKIAEIRARIGGSNGSITPDGNKPARKRALSAAARRRIAAAQRRRWATFRKSSQVTELVKQQKPVKAKKRNISAAGKKRIAEATRKRWAAFRAAKAGNVKKAA
jgi:hypothetical protein